MEKFGFFYLNLSYAKCFNNFLHRTNRNMIISSKIDNELEARFQRKIDRCKRKEEYTDQVQKNNDSITRDNKEEIGEKRQWKHNFFSNNEIDFNLADEEPTEPKKTRS